jgi:predicted amidohydrolase YtcJ
MWRANDNLTWFGYRTFGSIERRLKGCMHMRGDPYHVDRVVLNGRILTIDSAFTTVEALAIRDGRIVASGSTAEVRDLTRPGTRVDDLGGAVAMPGMLDQHNHLLSVSEMLADIQLFDARSIADILSRVDAAVERAAPGEWVVGRGWDESLLAERRFPTRWELDRVAPEHPVVLHRVWNKLVCNSAALALAGIDRAAPQPGGAYAGGFDLDEQGEPNGLFRDRAKQLILDHLPPRTRAQRQAALASGCRAYNAVGLVGVCEPGLYDPEIRVFQATRDAGQLSVRTGMLLGTWGFRDIAREAHLKDWLTELGVSTGFGDELLWLDGAKFLPDGGVGDRTARFYEPYAGETDYRGEWVIDPDEFPRLIRFAHDLGFAIDSHTCGTAAQDLAVRAYIAAQTANPQPRLRHRVHHAYFPSAEVLPLMAQHQIGALVSTPFIVNLGESYVTSLGEERATHTIPMRSYLNAGVPLAGSSDAPITDYNPWVGVYAAVARKTVAGRQFDPAEKLTRQEALRCYTSWAAAVTGHAASRGSLEPGKLADLIVLDRDPLSGSDEELRDTVVTRTMLAGEWVYER